MDKSSYECEIHWNKILGDIEIYDIGYLCKIDINCAKIYYSIQYITREKLEIYAARVTEYYLEFEALRENEYNKWFPTTC